jgi:cob(I)alamin adenosyltransferase
MGIEYQAAGYDFSLLASQRRSSSEAQQLQEEINSYNNSEFKNVFTPSLTTSTSALHTGRLVGRNSTISDISQQLINQNKETQNTYINAKDTYTRQGEINEWQAQNKLDTLFFLQILFVYFSIVVVLLNFV